MTGGTTVASGIQSETIWIAHRRPNPQAYAKLFAFPYSGAEASIYAAWPSQLPATVEVCPVQLPGRGRRMSEPFRSDFNALVDELAAALYAEFESRPFALFGHSLGALICFELARHLRRLKRRMPRSLVVSGCAAPDLLSEKPRISDLPMKDFENRLREMNGSMRMLLDEPELCGLFLPIIRADFALFENYVYVEDLPLACPIFTFGGLQDHMVPREQILAWKRHTSGHFGLTMLPGDHLFVNGSRAALISALTGHLNSLPQER